MNLYRPVSNYSMVYFPNKMSNDLIQRPRNNYLPEWTAGTKTSNYFIQRLRSNGFIQIPTWLQIITQ